MVSLKKLQKNRPASLLKNNGLENSEQIQWLAQFDTLLNRYLRPNNTVLLALSGGLDSIVLLHLLLSVKKSTPFTVYAMHVHHGISPNADVWANFCLDLCKCLDVPLEISRVNVKNHNQAGLEATARKLRYEALFCHQINGKKPDFILTAHHQNDQAETLLLQLFRGAGVKGLSCMPMADQAKRLLRPLLTVSRAFLYQYAEQHGLKWCEDESNSNTDYDRNFLRHQLMPVLETRYSGIQATLAKTASHLAEANFLLDALAKIDASPLIKENSLCLHGLSLLELDRVKNVLRWWFAQNALSMPSTVHLTEIVQQLLHAKSDANVSIVLQHLTLKRFQQRAFLIKAISEQPFDLVWKGEPTLTMPDGSQLHFKQVMGAGLALKFTGPTLNITKRKGGERFKLDAKRPTRTLKYLLQDAHIPPWKRDAFPLIYWQNTLVYLPNIGAAQGVLALENEAGLEITWQL